MYTVQYILKTVIFLLSLLKGSNFHNPLIIDAKVRVCL